MSVSDLMIHTADIQSQSTAKTSLGSHFVNWIDKEIGVDCRVHDASNDTKIEYGKLGIKVDSRIYFDSEHNLEITDRIVFRGKYYEVRAVKNAGGFIDELWEVDCEIKPS